MALLNNILSYRHLNGRRIVFCVLFSLFLLVVVLPAYAQEEDPYTVENIEVDVTASNAVEAREKAFEEAQIKGYEMLAERFLSGEELESFEAPDINTVSFLVKDYEVTNEKLSAVRYKGTYKIRYSSKAFGQGSDPGHMQQVSTLQQGEILIIPFYEISDRGYLWQANPFMEAWARARSNNVLGRAIIPVGDIEDVTQIRDEDLLNYDPSRLNAMRLRYQAKTASLLVASPEIMPDGTQNILVSIYNTKPYGPELSRQLSVRSYRGEMQEQLYNRVVAEVSKAFQSDWKRETAVNAVEPVPLNGPENTITAQLNFASVREWVDTKRSLEQMRQVKSVQVQSLSPRSAVLGINFIGDIEGLRLALQQAGIRLNAPMTQYTQAGTGQTGMYHLHIMRVPRQY